MSKYEYNGSEEFRPISPWGYVGYSLLFCIPLVGLILLIVFSFSSKNYNRRYYARSYFCVLLIALICLVISVVASGAFSVSLNGVFNDISSSLNNTVQSIPFINSASTKATVRPSSTESPSITDAPSIVDSVPVEEQDSDVQENSDVEPSDKVTNSGVQRDASGVDVSFKAAMDEYEAFFDEYLEALNSNDLMKMAQYTAQYAATMEAIENIDEDKLSTADLAYYAEVHARILQKLKAAGL